MANPKIYRECPRCERRVPVIMKMSAMICGVCRIVLTDAYTKEWYDAWKEIDIKTEDGHEDYE